MLHASIGRWWREAPAMANRQAHRLTTGLFFTAGGFIVLVATLWIDGPDADIAGIGAIGSSAMLVGILVLWLGDRLPVWVYHLSAVAGSAMVSCAVLLGQGGALSMAIGSLYLFVVVHVVFLFSLREALAHVALIVAMLIVSMQHVGAGGGDLVILCGAAFVLGAMVAWLARSASLAEQDSLTNLLNRRGFDRRVDELLQRARREGGQLTMAILDLDLFRSVNDDEGHQSGDRLLQACADVWRCELPDDVLLARHGGDEFALMFSNTSLGEAAILIDLLRMSVPSRITVSAGVAAWEPGDTASGLFHKADLALFDAKSSGRDQSVVYGDPSRSASELERAIANGELRLFLQPIVDLQSERIVSYEALSRWEHPRKGLIAPCEFVPQAERTGAVHALGIWALREAARLIASSPEPKPEIGVNVSVVQLRNERFPELVREVVEAYDIPASHLCIEVTESVFDEDDGMLFRAMSALSALGVQIAIDDFGAGYSSLGRLANMHVDCLKLDGSLVDLIREDSGQAPILEAIGSLGRSLGVKVLAEKIETEHQAETLRRLGYDLGQGYLFARPGPAEEVLQRGRAVPRSVRFEVS